MLYYILIFTFLGLILSILRSGFGDITLTKDGGLGVNPVHRKSYDSRCFHIPRVATYKQPNKDLIFETIERSLEKEFGCTIAHLALSCVHLKSDIFLPSVEVVRDVYRKAVLFSEKIRSEKEESSIFLGKIREEMKKHKIQGKEIERFLLMRARYALNPWEEKESLFRDLKGMPLDEVKKSLSLFESVKRDIVSEKVLRKAAELIFFKKCSEAEEVLKLAKQQLGFEDFAYNFKLRSQLSNISHLNALYSEILADEFINLCKLTMGLGNDISIEDMNEIAEDLKNKISSRETQIPSIEYLNALVLEALAEVRGVDVGLLEKIIIHCREKKISPVVYSLVLNRYKMSCEDLDVERCIKEFVIRTKLYDANKFSLSEAHPLRGISDTEIENRFFGGKVCAAIALRHIIKSLTLDKAAFTVEGVEMCSHSNVKFNVFKPGGEDEAKVRFYYAAYKASSKELFPSSILKKSGLKVKDKGMLVPMSHLCQKLFNCKKDSPAMMFLGIGGEKGKPGHAMTIRLDEKFHLMDPEFGVFEYETFEELIEGTCMYISTMYPHKKHVAMFEFMPSEA